MSLEFPSIEIANQPTTLNATNTKKVITDEMTPPSESSSTSTRTRMLPPPRHPRHSHTPTSLRLLDGPHPESHSNENQSITPQPSLWTGSTPIVAATKGPLPSIIFAIPFPDPAPHVQRSRKTPLFLL